MLDFVESRYNLGYNASSILLIHGFVSIKVYKRLQKLNLTMSHVVPFRLLTKFGDDHDARVKEWCAELAASLKQEHVDVGYSGLLCVNTYLTFSFHYSVVTRTSVHTCPDKCHNFLTAPVAVMPAPVQVLCLNLKFLPFIQ